MWNKKKTWNLFFILNRNFYISSVNQLKQKDMAEETNKKKLTQNIHFLSGLLGAQGMLNWDTQAIFMASSIELILQAAQNEKHAKLVMKHLENFIDDVTMMEGKMSVKDFLTQKEKICSN